VFRGLRRKEMKKALLLMIGMMLATANAETKTENANTSTNLPKKVVCEKPQTDKKYKRNQILTLVSVDVDKQTTADAEKWIEKNIYPPIDVQVVELKYKKDFSDKTVLFKELDKMKKNQFAIVALVQETPKGVSISNSVNVAGSAGIVYVGPYMTKYAKENPELELYKWRVNKESLKAAALAMGLKKCPFPRCCLSPDYDDARIDEKGRNLCPPCWKKMYELMKSKGIEEPIPPHLQKAIAK
jgi:predicted Zn-dependent protease